MKKKWLSVLMAAAMTMTTISPAVYAEDMSESLLEENSEEVMEQSNAELEEDDSDGVSEADDILTDDGTENEEEILFDENTENEENEIVFDETEGLDTDSESETTGNEENSIDLLSAMQEEFAVSTYSSSNDAPYSSIDKLENGTYTVTANVYVPGELNKVLVGTNAFLTNPKYPFGSGADKGKPTTAMYYNAELNVNDNDITVTLELKNPVFQAIQINDGSNITVADKTYNDELSNSEIHAKYGKKIQTLTLKLKDLSGLYEFGDCKEFASILYTEGNSATEADAVWDVPLKLAVDFQGIGKEVKEEKNYFLNSELQIALVTKNALPEGTVSNMYEITSDSTGKDGEVYQQFNTFLKENALNTDNYGFRVFYVGLKDANGNNIEDIQQYKPTFYTQATGFFPAYDGQTGQGMARIENGKLTTNIVYGSVGDAESDLSVFETENGEWDYTFKYEENSFTGGYVIVYDTNAAIPFKYHMEDNATGIGFNYYGVSNTGYNFSQEEEATSYYRILASKNKRGIGDETLETQLKENSGYTKLNWNTYQIAAYSLLTDPATNDILALGGYHENKIEIELPIDEKEDYQIYKIVYDKKKESYIEVSQVTDYIEDSGKVTILACGIEEEGSVKARTAQRLYGAATDDESYYGKRSRNTIQYYAVVSEGAVVDKPSVFSTTFTYDGTEKSLIPENQYYTVSGDVSKKLPGSYKVTVTLKDGYAWKDGTTDPVEINWIIKALQTEKPSVVTGLTYNGKNQNGVLSGTGYNLAGTYAAKDAGSYIAKALLAEGYEWSDGTTDPLTLTWKIDKKKVAKPSAVKNLTYNEKAQMGVQNGEGYTVTGNVQTAPGTYTATATLDKNYAWTDGSNAAEDISWSINKAEQNLNINTVSKSYKVSAVKKKAQTFTISAAGKGKITYKVTGTPSKKAAKYLTVNKNGKVTVKKGAPAGTYTITVSAAATDSYRAAASTVTVKVKKASQKVTAKVSSKTIKAKQIAKKNSTFSIGAKGKGKLSYKVTATPENAAKYISVSKKGKVTVKKAAPKGTYKITVTAAGDATYAEGNKTITVKVK